MHSGLEQGDDLMDIRFLPQSDKISTRELLGAFDRARVPDVPEVRELFKNAQPNVLESSKALEGK